ncbi:MAG: DJ-1/PfpI family protein [Oscillospiraceae bacterium]|nr:DJ-1/PfpI family protein [Oscillospiraceae bacterium]
MKAVVFFATGFEECEALIVVDILRRAGIETVMVSVTELLEVESSRHIVLRADAMAADVDYASADLIVLPGGRLGTENLKDSRAIQDIVKDFAADKMIAAICAAPSILASLGLLDGRQATCHPDYENQMAGAILTHESVTVDGNIITGQGLGTTFDFAFEIVKRLIGNRKVQQIKTAICYK